MVETVVEAEVASEEVSKIIEALTRTTEEEAETSIKEVAIISTLVVEVALTRWEIPKEDSNLKIANLRVQAVVQTTKLSCADILSFTAIADMKTSAPTLMEKLSLGNTRIHQVVVVAEVPTK